MIIIVSYKQTRDLKMKLLTASLTASIVIASLVTLNVYAGNIEKDVKSNKADLHCFIGTIEKKIDPELIEYEVDGYWKFTNGGASNCRVVYK